MCPKCPLQSRVQVATHWPGSLQDKSFLLGQTQRAEGPVPPSWMGEQGQAWEAA